MVPIILERSDTTGNWIKGHDRGGLCSSFTWDGLQAMLRDAGKLKEGERIDKIQLTSEGLKYYIETE